ncbi:hypothetical protein BDV96DRAFT_630096 [Lophiotrema nucula]|uniref:Uncharacterized protein n=1 Tax=Lophiotrema nucula TaxID=690887 RepID=A0A6A5ZGH4_9PLEO|nr:hypothetical protein BDV96DRAFT_630096 [Lophiotrema nucula]
MWLLSLSGLVAIATAQTTLDQPPGPQHLRTIGHTPGAGLFEITNATEAASASAASASQASAYPIPSTTTGTPTVGFTSPTLGVRNMTFPPYALNLTLEGHSLLRQAVAPYASHNDEFNTTEYELHNTYGYTSAKATYNALLQVFPAKSPFFIA